MVDEEPSLVGDVVVRGAKPEDFDAIVSVVDDWWGRPMAANLARLFLDHFFSTSLVAERDGALVGFVIGFLSPSKPAEAYIHFTGIAPECRRGGLARHLYERFVGIALITTGPRSRRSPHRRTPRRSPSIAPWASGVRTRSATTTDQPCRASSSPAPSDAGRAVAVWSFRNTVAPASVSGIGAAGRVLDLDPSTGPTMPAWTSTWTSSCKLR